ncbi:MAG: cysteine desulfurase family protein [Candidatus Woesearchaeota archaeon]
MKQIYMDNGATTKIDPNVLKEMMPYFTDKYANPSSFHSFGQEAKDAVEKSRLIIAKAINADDKEIFFTSGGTESNNLALKGIAFSCKNRSDNKSLDQSEKNASKKNCTENQIITTKIEHKCILNTCRWLEEQGFKITYLEVDKEGFVNPEDIRKSITDKTILVSIIHANNEVGTIQDLEAIGKVIADVNKYRKKRNINSRIYFHTDACQSFTKTELDVQKYNLDLVTLNAHKIHGPKGVGALFIRRELIQKGKIISWQHGGSHESGIRAGTENVHGIVGFGKAVEVGMKDMEKNVKHMTLLRDRLIDGIISAVPNIKLNGPAIQKDSRKNKKISETDRRLCNNINFSFRAIEGESLGGYLDQKGICSSTGSACNAINLEPSYVLTAMGLDDEEANGSLRLSLSKFNTEEEVDYVLKVLPKIVEKLRFISPIGKEVNIK